jgi:hypothetical protein
MFEHHHTKMATFGGHLDRPMEFKGIYFYVTQRGVWTLMSVLAGMAGNQVLEWVDLDSEIKTAGLKQVRRKEVEALVSPFRSLTVVHRMLLPLRTCESCTCHRRGSSNYDHRLVSGNMRHNWRTGKPIH